MIDTELAPEATPSDAVIAEVMSWVVAHLDADHSLDSLARRAFMSRRSFVRHFRRVTGSSPYDWVLAQRIARTQELLGQGSLTVEGIAAATARRYPIAPALAGLSSVDGGLHPVSAGDPSPARCFQSPQQY